MDSAAWCRGSGQARAAAISSSGPVLPLASSAREAQVTDGVIPTGRSVEV